VTLTSYDAHWPDRIKVPRVVGMSVGAALRLPEFVPRGADGAALLDAFVTGDAAPDAVIVEAKPVPGTSVSLGSRVCLTARKQSPASLDLLEGGEPTGDAVAPVDPPVPPAEGPGVEREQPVEPEPATGYRGPQIGRIVVEPAGGTLIVRHREAIALTATIYDTEGREMVGERLGKTGLAWYVDNPSFVCLTGSGRSVSVELLKAPEAMLIEDPARVLSVNVLLTTGTLNRVIPFTIRMSPGPEGWRDKSTWAEQPGGGWEDVTPPAARKPPSEKTKPKGRELVPWDTDLAGTWRDLWTGTRVRVTRRGAQYVGVVVEYNPRGRSFAARFLHVPREGIWYATAAGRNLDGYGVFKGCVKRVRRTRDVIVTEWLDATFTTDWRQQELIIGFRTKDEAWGWWWSRWKRTK
jgi:hypothetical protein